MKAICRLFIFVLLVGGWTLAALAIHVIRTPGEFAVTLVTKDKLSFRETWVDTTKWTLDDVGRHPAVVVRLIRTDQADVLEHVTDSSHGKVERQLTDALARAPHADEDGAGQRAEQITKRWFRWPWESRG